MNHPYPPPLMTSESFARYTVVHRLPSIVTDVIAENDYPPAIVSTLEVLRDELGEHSIAPLTQDAPDAAAWNRAREPYCDHSWLEIPWYFAESYFYRRLLEAICYFRPGDFQGRDPFEHRKKGALKGEAARKLLKMVLAGEAADEKERFARLLHASLWGNRADLSNIILAAGPEEGLDCASGDDLLLDHSPAAWPLIAPGRLRRVDFLCDNAGLEALLDLVLIDFLLDSGLCQQIVFHLKDRPFFVSDTMIQDIAPMLAALRQIGGPAADLASRLEAHRRGGRWILKSDPFWTSWLCFAEMPAHLYDELAQSDLIILKGDLNYRRLLGDRRWPPTMPLEEAANYFPLPFMTLRTLKSEIIVGLREGEAEKLTATDPDWLVNGRRGLIHLVRRET